MGSQRAHVLLPEDLVKEIDSVVGPRGRSAFLVETARAELNRRWLIGFLSQKGAFWKDEDYPELATMGTEAWVAALRRDPDEEIDTTIPQ